MLILLMQSSFVYDLKRKLFSFVVALNAEGWAILEITNFVSLQSSLCCYVLIIWSYVYTVC